MPDPRYCEPCQRVLSGTVQFNDGVEFIHHRDAGSLVKSLELNCPICLLAYRCSVENATTANGTRGYFYYGHLRLKVLSLSWDWPSTKSQDIIFVPWKDMLDYSFPSPLSSRTDSSSAHDFLLRTYRDCKDTHFGCKPQNSQGAFPPSRVIDVGESTSSRVHLQDTQSFTDASYTCLSYCWGKTQPLLLTKQTEAVLYNGVSVSALSKTAQDAIYVTRILGIRYLWIDSLCIFQDNEADWSREASRMGRIYRHAVCTLAATSAEDSAGGLFFDRNPKTLQSLRIECLDTPDINVLRAGSPWPPKGLYWCDHLDTWTSNVEYSPLARRAWVCQERHLSSRIIHFTKCGLFWECHEHKASENYPDGMPGWTKSVWHADPTALKRELHRLETPSITSSQGSTGSGKINLKNHIDPLSTHSIYSAWGQFRIAYSHCDLTREEDKLVAIRGIADHMSTVVGDQLIAGLWRSHLLDELCWFRTIQGAASRKPTKWRAPTWSWASTDGRIWGALSYDNHKSCLGWRTVSEIDSVDVKSRPSGELEHATLRLRCRPISAVLRVEKDVLGGYRVLGTLTLNSSKVQLHHTSRKGTVELVLYLDSSPWEESRSLFMVVIQECSHENNDLKLVVEGLLVVLHDGCEDVFQRVGLFKILGVDGFTKMSGAHETAEEAIITLI